MQKHKSKIISLVISSAFVAVVGLVCGPIYSSKVGAAPFNSGPTTTTKYTCGSGDNAVKVSINFGCTGKGTALVDVTFAILRFLTLGVGLVIIGSIVYGGIQYTTSHGDPGATSKAIGRIRNSFFALLIYIFGAAILSFIIPEGFFG